jgi:Dyp-type peroxidase family
MTSIATLLDAPIRAGSAATDPDVRNFLHELQANILKGHGRRHSAHMFLRFAGMAPDNVAAVLRALGRHCTSAEEQLRRNIRHKPHLDGGPVRCLFLSAGGFRALAHHAALPPGAAFATGMASRGPELNDPPRAGWQVPGFGEGEPAIDAMFLVAHATETAVTSDLEQIEMWLNGTGVRIAAIERGFQQVRRFAADSAPEGVEHFGYVDGRSQPLFLLEDIQEELAHAGGANWPPAFKPAQFIVPDPNGRSPMAAGSYFVFRKLEQNVRAFKQAEEALADRLGLAGADRRRAGAMAVGRFEDGTPLTLHGAPTGQAPPNDFNFAADADGLRCPFHAHIRKTNPRGDLERLGLPDTAERNPAMARRGITYGQRKLNDAEDDFADQGEEPSADVGLLFMAYMASIEDQFEFMQHSWANDPRFAGNLDPGTSRPPTGIDPVIGQGAGPGVDQTWQDGWTNGAQPVTMGFSNFVTLRGGEYFFAPSLSFLRSVGA